MIFHDFECTNCGHFHEDVVFDSHREVQRQIDCTQCDGVATMRFTRSNFLHQRHSGMYGKWHDGFGCVVESYSHKQTLLKKYKVIESADPVGGSRCHIASEITTPKAEGPEWSYGGTPAEAVAAAQRQLEE